jgi:hypothetical protein
MALIFTKSSSYGYDNTLVITPRSGVSIPFNFGNWTEIRMGMYWTGVATSSGYISGSGLASETVTILTSADHIVMGLKSETPNRHGTAGTNFVGSSTNANHYCQDGAWGLIFSSYGKVAASWIGTTEYIGTDLNNGNGGYNFYNAKEVVDYNFFKGLRFVLYNSGSANQYMRIYSMNAAPSAPAGPAMYGADALRTQLLNTTWTEYASTASWTSGGSPLPIPNCWYFWNPYYYNAARISALEVVKVL